MATQYPSDIIEPGSPSEYINYLLAVGDLPAARRWQNEKVLEGRRAALNGERFCEAFPAAWQVGYVEALQDMEH